MSAKVCTFSLKDRGTPLTLARFSYLFTQVAMHVLTDHPDGPPGHFSVCCYEADRTAVENYIETTVSAAAGVAHDLDLDDSAPTIGDIVLLDMPPQPGAILTISLVRPDTETQKG